MSKLIADIRLNVWITFWEDPSLDFSLAETITNCFQRSMPLHWHRCVISARGTASFIVSSCQTILLWCPAATIYVHCINVGPRSFESVCNFYAQHFPVWYLSYYLKLFMLFFTHYVWTPSLPTFTHYISTAQILLLKIRCFEICSSTCTAFLEHGRLIILQMATTH